MDQQPNASTKITSSLVLSSETGIGKTKVITHLIVHAQKSRNVLDDKPHLFHCDVCSGGIFDDVMYSCGSCPNFDVCTKCFPTIYEHHYPDHIFSKAIKNEIIVCDQYSGKIKKITWSEDRKDIVQIRVGRVKQQFFRKFKNINHGPVLVDAPETVNESRETIKSNDPVGSLSDEPINEPQESTAQEHICEEPLRFVSTFSEINTQ